MATIDDRRLTNTLPFIISFITTLSSLHSLVIFSADIQTTIERLERPIFSTAAVADLPFTQLLEPPDSSLVQDISFTGSIDDSA